VFIRIGLCRSGDLIEPEKHDSPGCRTAGVGGVAAIGGSCLFADRQRPAVSQQLNCEQDCDCLRPDEPRAALPGIVLPKGDMQGDGLADKGTTDDAGIGVLASEQNFSSEK
jgi:hypothetical protein